MLRAPDEWSRRGLERASLFSWARTAREHDAVYGELMRLTRLQVLELGVDQEAHERVERHLRLPAEPGTGTGRVADEVVQLCLAALQRLVDHHILAPVETDVPEREADEILDRVRLAAREHVVAGLVLLQHQPLAADVVVGVAPVTSRGQVAEPQARSVARA